MPDLSDLAATTNRQRNSAPCHFIILYGLLATLTLADFLLTHDPYNSVHDPGTGVAEMAWAFPVVVGGCLLVYLLFQVGIGFISTGFRPDATTAVLCGLAGVSGIMNGCIFERAKTYVFWIVAVVALSFASRRDATLSARNPRWFSQLSWLAALFWWIGIVLVVIKPETYGTIPLTISRDSRGEISLWFILGLYELMPCVALVNILDRRFSRKRRLLWVGIYILCILLALSTARRVWMFQVLATLLCGLFAVGDRVARLTLVAVLALLVVVSIAGSSTVRGLVLLANESSVSGGGSDLERLANGRAELWELHWKSFLSEPLFGAGPFVFERFGRTSNASFAGQAGYEIGFFCIPSEWGIFVASLVLFILWFSARNAWRCIFNGKFVSFPSFDSLFALYLVVNVPCFLTELYSRVVTPQDVVFWYALFYFWHNDLDSKALDVP